MDGANAHLASCNDAKAIAAHTAARAAAEQRRNATSRGQLAQEEAMAVAQWEFGESLDKICCIMLAGSHIIISLLTGLVVHARAQVGAKSGSCGC